MRYVDLERVEGHPFLFSLFVLDSDFDFEVRVYACLVEVVLFIALSCFDQAILLRLCFALLLIAIAIAKM
jgi:hypothetical protein